METENEQLAELLFLSQLIFNRCSEIMEVSSLGNQILLGDKGVAKDPQQNKMCC